MVYIISRKFKLKLLVILTILIIIFNLTLYAFDKIVTPTVLAVGDADIREKVTSIVNKVLINEYSNNFNYESIIKVDKDNLGNIVMMKADTLKMSKIASDVSIKIQDNLRKMGEVGIKLPLGYIFKNNLLSYLGPKLTIKIEPVGSVETNYDSQFEGAGINQTRFKIYVKVKTKVRVIIPTAYNDIEVKNEIPVAETIIIGKIPNSAFELKLNKAGYKSNEK